MLALLHDDHLGPALLDPTSRPEEVGLPRELAHLLVVHHEDVDSLHEIEQRVTTSRDPVVHGVAGDQFRVAHLLENVELQLRIDVRQKDILGIAIMLRQLRLKGFEDVEVSFQGMGLIQVILVPPFPTKGLTWAALQTTQIDFTSDEKIDMFLRKILSDHRHQ